MEQQKSDVDKRKLDLINKTGEEFVAADCYRSLQISKCMKTQKTLKIYAKKMKGMQKSVMKCKEIMDSGSYYASSAEEYARCMSEAEEKLKKLVEKTYEKLDDLGAVGDL